MTLLLIYWVFVGLENFFRWALEIFIDPSSYFFGLGWISALLFTMGLGILVQISILKRLEEWITKTSLKLPVIKTLWQMSSDLMMFLTKKGIKQGKMVKVKTPFGNLLGIITQNQLDELPSGIGGSNEVAVYIPMSYQIGGYTVIVSKDAIEAIDISIQQGVALTMTAYISGKD